MLQIDGEARKLLERHGERFRAYCASTPRLILRFLQLNEPRSYMVRPEKFRQWMEDALWFVWRLGIVEGI